MNKAQRYKRTNAQIIEERISAFVLLSVCAFLPLSAQAQSSNAGNAPTATSSTESFLEAFFLSRITHANGEKTVDFVGTSMLWLLLAMSIVNLGLIGYLAMTNQRKTIVPAGVLAEVRRLLNAGDYRK